MRRETKGGIDKGERKVQQRNRGVEEEEEGDRDENSTRKRR